MKRKLSVFCVIAVAVLFANSALLWAFPAATAFNVANVLLHIVLGAAVGILAVLLSRAQPRLGWLVAAAASGILLTVIGNTHDHRSVLIVHVVLSLAAVAVLFARRENFRIARVAATAAAVVMAGGIGYRLDTRTSGQIKNSLVVPLTMNQEGAGPKSPFFPSGANTANGKLVPASFFMEAKKCGECHKDIYQQWKSSAHHFSSFNNQFYRKSIVYMQRAVGVRPSKWCAGCHDHAVFFNGRFDRPIKYQLDTPQARAGLTCMSCHSISHVNGSIGNADFIMSYPPLDEIAASRNPLIHNLEYFVTYAAPEAHRRTFMRPFMKSPKFCASCHKVHMDVPVNDYRWSRGFDEYDNWQASGISGFGARSFYYPAKPKTCINCHMPLVRSHDPGNIDGFVHSHRFPAANTALPFVNHDKKQLAVTEKFLKSGFITVDIFAASPVSHERHETEMARRSYNEPQAETTFAVGQEAEHHAPAVIRKVGQVAAPLDLSGLTLQPGETTRIDVVVRTRHIGHFFPGGTVDAFDVWLELKAVDDSGKPIFWSGKVEDHGTGPVDPGAHFYRSYQLDAAGNLIDKRNTYQTRSTLYVHLIPPGAADTVHYLVHVPRNAKGHIHFTAKLNYRKFSWYFTQWAYAGKPIPGQPAYLLTKDRNGLKYSFDPKNIPADVSGQIKGEIPNLPIVTLAEAHLSLPVSAKPPVWRAVTSRGTRESWNDWGIGLLLQGDLKGAEYAFKEAAEAEPGYADAYINEARALIQEGETDAAKPYLRHAMKINPSLGRIYFFEALTQKADGNYDGALRSLERVASQYPDDRVVLNEIARILLLKRDYAKAIGYLNRVCGIDPENLQMHYTAMLCYRGLGEQEKANREMILFRRFKANEAAQSIT
ncbi:MAG: tetratricopeptide repeat protein, partial [Bryobacteraceae bacterium]